MMTRISDIPGFTYAACMLAACIFSKAATAAILPHQNTGNLYVSMWSADEIAVFTPDGTPLERFSAAGLDGPRGIAFNPANGEIWVAGEFSNAIFIFDHQHQFLRRLDHSDFNEPVGITFSPQLSSEPSDQQVYISNSNGNEVMVFDESENLVQRFTGTALVDPNCDNQFQFDFTTTGIASLMAVARDQNDVQSALDDTVWVTSGAGDSGIYEFDQAGNLLKSLLPADIDDGRNVVPQGIAFDDEGNFVVISYLNEVIKFDGDGNFITRFPTGAGTARSTAFQACEPQQDAGTGCVALGASATTSVDNIDSTGAGSSGGGGGAFSIWLLAVCLRLRRFRIASVS